MDSSEKTAASVIGPGLLVAFVKSTRPKQWTKNLLVFMAFFFTIDQEWDLAEIETGVRFFAKSAIAFVLFSALSGAVYLVNDIVDVEKDRQHPRKRFRPIASGKLPVPLAQVGAAILAVAGLAVAYALEPLLGLVAALYLTTMLFYSFMLKKIVLLDVFSIAAGFILRAVAGAAVLQVPISPWLYICTGLGALFIALSKRRSELALAGEDAAKQRDILNTYSVPLLDQFVAVVAPATVVSYALYTVTSENLPENDAMLLTVPFVVYGLFRYMFLVHRKGLGEAPEDILITDVPLIISIVLWLATAATVLVVFRG
jgi:4-hydroxybenzoate polyprenyltransferase